MGQVQEMVWKYYVSVKEITLFDHESSLIYAWCLRVDHKVLIHNGVNHLK